jgi:Mrp family chromosome partitioning ATPase
LPDPGLVSAESVFVASARHDPKARLCPVLIVFAGKGGVGKSTTALSLAERAAIMIPNFRVVVVDMNRGQGDLRTFLKLTESRLPSVYDAAISRDIEVYDDIIVTPKRLSVHRKGRADLHFGIVLAPTRDQVDPSSSTLRSTPPLLSELAPRRTSS